MFRRLETDKWLFISTVALCLIGAVMVFSASAVTARADYGHAYHFLLRQLAFLVLGVGGMFALMNIDYRIMRKPAVIFSGLGAVVLLLIAVFFLDKHHETHRWIAFGGVGYSAFGTCKACGDRVSRVVSGTAHACRREQHE